MNPMPGHLFEGNPVGEGTKRRGKQEVAGWKHCPAKKGRSERDVAKARGRWTVVSSYVKVGE